MTKRNVLLLGSGGREHAIAWELRQSHRLGKMFVAPGNAGTLKLPPCQNVAIDPLDFVSIKKFVLENDIHIVIPGSELPLAKGIVDYFQNDEDLRYSPLIFGPTQEAAKLESSKAYAKYFMHKYGIPTADFCILTEADKDIISELKSLK
jgi:phosphoribosylamine---glycine ligase